MTNIQYPIRLHFFKRILDLSGPNGVKAHLYGAEVIKIEERDKVKILGDFGEIQLNIGALSYIEIEDKTFKIDNDGDWIPKIIHHLYLTKAMTKQEYRSLTFVLGTIKSESNTTISLPDLYGLRKAEFIKVITGGLFINHHNNMYTITDMCNVSDLGVGDICISTTKLYNTLHIFKITSKQLFTTQQITPILININKKELQRSHEYTDEQIERILNSSLGMTPNQNLIMVNRLTADMNKYYDWTIRYKPVGSDIYMIDYHSEPIFIAANLNVWKLILVDNVFTDFLPIIQGKINNNQKLNVFELYNPLLTKLYQSDKLQFRNNKVSKIIQERFGTQTSAGMNILLD